MQKIYKNVSLLVLNYFSLRCALNGYRSCFSEEETTTEKSISRTFTLVIRAEEADRILQDIFHEANS